MVLRLILLGLVITEPAKAHQVAILEQTEAVGMRRQGGLGRAVFEKSSLIPGERVGWCARACRSSLVMVVQLPELLSCCS